MLVLTRKPDQKIAIGDDIEIIVTEVRGGTVRIGIRAPADIPVYRAELLESVKRQNLQAASSLPEDIRELEGLLDDVKKQPRRTDNSCGAKKQ